MPAVVETKELDALKGGGIVLELADGTRFLLLRRRRLGKFNPPNVRDPAVLWKGKKRLRFPGKLTPLRLPWFLEKALRYAPCAGGL